MKDQQLPVFKLLYCMQFALYTTVTKQVLQYTQYCNIFHDKLLNFVEEVVSIAQHYCHAVC